MSAQRARLARQRGSGRRAGAVGWVVYALVVIVLVIAAFTATYAMKTHNSAQAQGALTASASAQDWWRTGSLGRACDNGKSPAELISIVHQLGVEPEVTEHRTVLGELTSVEVRTPTDGDDDVANMTFYRNRQACEDGRAANKPIPQEYK